MEFTVVGLGAIGGLLAARLAAQGHRVRALARGATLQAVREHGLELVCDGAPSRIGLEVQDDPRALGAADCLILALKAPALVESVARLRPLIGPDTLVLPAMNGVPWWFLATLDGTLSDAPLGSVDPGGHLAAHLPLGQVLGCVVHLSASCPAPGRVRHGFGQRLIVGEPRGGLSARAQALRAVLEAAGFHAQVSEDIRGDIWFKLWGNMTMNPVSALTGAASDRILDDPLVCDFMGRAMAEAAAIGARIGCPISQSAADRMAVTRQLGSFKTSMLQDALAGRPLELDALVGAVREIGARLSLPTPSIDALLGLTRLMARERGLLPARPASDADLDTDRCAGAGAPTAPSSSAPTGR